MAGKSKRSKRPGPEAERLSVAGDWEAAVSRALGVPRPAAGWPKPAKSAKRKAGAKKRRAKKRGN